MFARNVWGLDDDDEFALAEKGIDALYGFFKENGIPMTLSELGIGTENFKKMAEDAVLYGDLANAFVPLSASDVEKIFEACL